MSEKAPRAGTEEVAKVIRDQHRKLGLPEPTYDQSLKRAQQSARDAERKGNR